jgi:endonuclease-3
MSKLTVAQIKKCIASVGLTNMKAKNIKATAEILVNKHAAVVPSDMESLVALPGVGRKTANVVRGVAFDFPALVVDTHVTRISNLLKLTNSKNAEIIEREISQNLPKKYWSKWAHLMIDHGRAVCVARRPQCAICVLKDLCPSAK